MIEKQLKQKARELGDQPAFPGSKDGGLLQPCLTKREYFAGEAMQNLIDQNAKFLYSHHQAAKIAVEQADALLEELVREQQ